MAYSLHSAVEAIGSNPSAHQFVASSITKYCRNVGDGAFDSDGSVDGAYDCDVS